MSLKFVIFFMPIVFRLIYNFVRKCYKDFFILKNLEFPQIL
jgi:hypothetical protein